MATGLNLRDKCGNYEYKRGHSKRNKQDQTLMLKKDRTYQRTN